MLTVPIGSSSECQVMFSCERERIKQEILTVEKQDPVSAQLSSDYQSIK